MIATVPPVRDWPVRPATPLALETKVRFSVSASEPARAVEAVTVTSPVRPAAVFTRAEADSFALATVPVTSRLSWKAALVTTVFVTPTVRVRPVAPLRTLPKASGAALKSACA